MEEVDESQLAFKNDCMFYLNEAFNNFFSDYDIKFEIIEEEDYHLFEIEYFTKVIINNNNYYFIFNETLYNNVPVKLLFRHDKSVFIGATEIFNKIIDIIKDDLVIHEINKIDFEIRGCANLMTKFNIPLEIALICL